MNGLKSLARELPQYGRYNDDMVAHISSDEARLLKSLGGSGTINPTTGLPEFGMFGIGGGGGILGTGINKNASDPVSNALSNNPVSQGISKGVQGAGNIVDQGLVSLDKTVGKVIPGGWGTVGMVAGSAMGLPTWAMTGLGALNGSGVLRKGGKFNLQGAMMGGAMAYGMSELGEYMRAAAPTEAAMLPVSDVAKNVPVDAIESLNASQGWTGPAATNVGSDISQSAINSANAATNVAQNVNPATGLQYGSTLGDTLSGTVPPAPPSVTSQFLSGNVGDAFNQIGTNISEGVSNLGTRVADTASDAYKSLGNFADKATTLDTYGNAIDRGMSNASQTGSGIQNLMGLGEGTAKEAAAAAAKSGVSPMMASAATLYGATGLAGLEEQRKLLDEQKATNAISQAEYDKAMNEITRSEDVARKAVKESPFSTNPNRDVSIGDTYYGRTGANENLYARNNSTLYAAGGGVDSLDDQTGMPNRSPVDGLAMGGMGGMGYAAGGTARFLSGGGDGMSDSIPATIEGKQEARLADGEFVIPADVVSHLGNGSSKAGAKQLYSMMDKVRKARTGNPKQGKQINPRKYLAA